MTYVKSTHQLARLDTGTNIRGVFVPCSRNHTPFCTLPTDRHVDEDILTTSVSGPRSYQMVTTKPYVSEELWYLQLFERLSLFRRESYARDDALFEPLDLHWCR